MYRQVGKWLDLIDRQRERDGRWEVDWMEGKTCRQMENQRCLDGRTDRWTDRQTDGESKMFGWMGRQTDRQMDRQTDRWRIKVTSLHPVPTLLPVCTA